MNRIEYQRFISAFIFIAIIYFIIMAVLLCLTPPIARDALIHHLAIPKLWINHSGFYDTPWAIYSYYPMNLELLYLISLYFGNDIIPNFVHLGFGIGTAVMICFYLKSRFNQIAGLLGFLIFISTPVISKLSTMAYVDLGMVFFITASVLSFIRWRDSKYDQSRWLLISAIAMGLALGTKYSSLVPWFFVTLAIVFIYSRDTGNSGKAIKYGLIFFITSLAVFSPWLVKNFILTGNPFYPLFPGIFDRGGDGSANALALVQGHVSLFKTRGMLFGESLWEILLIPIRIFFQGQDNSPRYFDGVLNPILILFVPLAIMKKDMKIEKLFFLYFSFFIILIAFFLDQIRIRYILPAIPFLAILSVTGFMNVFTWLTESKSFFLRRISSSGLVIMLVVLLSLNVVYIQQYFLKIDPVRYLTNRETRDNFIARHDGSYSAILYINRNTPNDSRIRLILLAGRGYYLDRIYQEDRSMGMSVIKEMIDHSSSGELFQQYLSSLDCTHLLIRYELFEPYIQEKFDSEKVNQLKKRMSDTLMKIYDDNHYRIFRIAK
ncbi:MAG: hypothetical protein CVU51_03375 [Deltaproteobacteria bacterium HGW-Deltaproteobacteria-1]|jgi:hypothetical protein|nr:MAG: hypothetical protein CVU51_03375 [Deltaproteobacteria bacterium HGW-Deltaproteobacteria-1]